MINHRHNKIIVAARVSFAAVHQIQDRLYGVDFPIELALPYKYLWWQEATEHFEEMLSVLKELDLVVPTIHATQSRITGSEFLKWGRQTLEIAECLGAKTVTVHPNRVAKNRRADFQESVRMHLRELRHNSKVLISVETFGGKDRVFRPEELVASKLPMTMDVAHIAENGRLLRIIESHWQHIPVVHLSARGNNYWGQQSGIPLSEEGRSEHHMPVDPFCMGVVRKLVKLGWGGTVVLEYMPWYHYRLRSDVKLVAEALTRDIATDELPPPCDAYRGMNEMYGHNAPPPK